MFNKLNKRVNLLEDGELEDLKIMKTIESRVSLLEKCDNYNTMYQEQADKRIKELEENLRLVYEYLGVHKEVINETCLVEDDCICDDCLANEDNWEDVKPKKKK
jgi:hypothetical protein